MQNKHIPPKPTAEERRMLIAYLILKDWHFETLFRGHCTLISDNVIYWDKDLNGNHRRHIASIYGLEAMEIETKKSVIDNFFIRYGARLFQSNSIHGAVKRIEFLKKEHLWEEYEEKTYQEKLKKQQEVKNAKLLPGRKRPNNFHS